MALSTEFSNEIEEIEDSSQREEDVHLSKHNKSVIKRWECVCHVIDANFSSVLRLHCDPEKWQFSLI